jgi:hypothetical protein
MVRFLAGTSDIYFYVLHIVQASQLWSPYSLLSSEYCSSFLGDEMVECEDEH